ncbi:MAG: 2-succinyl-6-hydroxy-2,4-cyclohexadiene-1-carboxylate synthase [Myxococcota bacterium]
MSAGGFVEIDGVRLRVDTWGEGDPVLLLHGFTGTGRGMGALARRLARSHRVIAPDLVGHGESSAPDDASAYTMERCVSALAAVMEAFDAAPFHLFGYSMGGRVGLHCLARHPRRVRRAVLLGASPGVADAGLREARRRADEELARSILRDGVPAFARRWAAHPLFASQAKRLAIAERERLDRERCAQRAVGLANSLRGMGAGAQAPLHQSLPRLDVPLLLLAGSDDPKFQAIAEEMAARLPAAEVAFVPEAGHAAHLENPDAVAQLATRFFTNREPPTHEVRT